MDRLKCAVQLAVSLQACWVSQEHTRVGQEADLHLTGSSSSPACAAGACAAGADVFPTLNVNMSSATSLGLGGGLGLSSMALKHCHRSHCGVLAP